MQTPIDARIEYLQKKLAATTKYSVANLDNERQELAKLTGSAFVPRHILQQLREKK